MNIKQLFPSKYVAAADLPASGIVVTIKDMTIETLRGEHQTEDKPVLWFVNATKGMILNRTNGMIVAGLYGDETDGWAGKRIELYPTKVKAFGKLQDAVRVRERRYEPVPKTPPAEASDIDEPEDVLDYAETSSMEQPHDNPFEDDAPNPVDVAISELKGQPLKTILLWGVDHISRPDDASPTLTDAKELWNAIVAEHGGITPTNGAAITVAYVRRVLAVAA